MSSSVLITVVLIVLLIAAQPFWKYSRMWGGGYTPVIFVGAILAAHMYTIMFTKGT